VAADPGAAGPAQGRKEAGLKPRLRPLAREEADGSVHADFDAFVKARGKVPNLFGTLARRPALMRAVAALLREAMAPGEVPVRLKELVALRVSRANGCDYCAASHTKLAVAAGATDADLAAVQDPSGGVLDDAEKAALRFADAVAAPGGRVPETVWSALRARWSETACLELAAVASAFSMFNRLANSLEVEITR
jgi:uncharacterized peroxidase-related enzyme